MPILAPLLVALIVPMPAPTPRAPHPPAPAPAPAEDRVEDQAVRKTAGGSAAAPAPRVSEAEQIARLQRAIKLDTAALAEMTARLEDPAGEYHRAKAAFEAADDARQKVLDRVKELEEAGLAAEAEASRAALGPAESERSLAKERFDLALEERKILNQEIETLNQKLAQQRQALDLMTGDARPASPAQAQPGAPAAAPAPAPAAAPAPAPALTAPALSPAPAQVQATVPTPTPTPAPDAAAPAAPPGSMPVASVAAPTPPPAAPAAEPSPELVKARTDATTKAERNRLAEQDVESVAGRMAVLDQSIDQIRKLQATAESMAENANQARAAIARRLHEKSIAGTDPAELTALVGQLREAEERSHEARVALRERTARLDELQSERAQLQAEQLRTLRKAEEARAQLAQADKAIERLENPFAPTNLLRWLLQHGPRLLAIVVGTLLLQGFSRLSARRIIRLMSHKGFTGSAEERENRARTLVGVFQNAASVAVVAGGFMMLFQEVGIPIAPVMGGAAVLGLAVAFGAQNLIRDYFYGFVILLENQYKINDVVKIGDCSGQVEQITLRMTVLRDLEGRAHFLPNGAIASVTNYTHGWSRALFDLGVAYKEDADRVMQVVQELGQELRRDPLYGHLILEDLVMLGVDGFADSAVVIKFFIKTRPLQQWNVKREMLRRIKRRFDELGIEIPFPHRTVYHRTDDGSVNLEGPRERRFGILSARGD